MTFTLEQRLTEIEKKIDILINNMEHKYYPLGYPIGTRDYTTPYIPPPTYIPTLTYINPYIVTCGDKYYSSYTGDQE